MNIIALAAIVLGGGTLLYAYVAYPLILRLAVAVFGERELPEGPPEEWPAVSISLPVYNEEAVVADTLENLLALDYPSDKLQILVMSDASTDRTDEIVRTYSDRGVQLVRLDERRGKTAAENAAVSHVEGEIVLNTDATTRILPGSLKELVRVFQDPTVGVASGWDRSVNRGEVDPVVGESRYVRYEMGVRDLETRLGTLVGASGCLYAARRELHGVLVPEELSRDFIAALHAWEEGFRTVSVPEAVALVPRARSLRSEYRRKVRTMARGLDSLWSHRELLNPLRHGRFAWMLASHKLGRWLVPLTAPAALGGLAWYSLAVGSPLATAALGCVAGVAALGAAGVAWPEGREIPRPLALGGYVVVGLSAGFVAWMKAIQRERNPVWSPTRRDPSAVDT